MADKRRPTTNVSFPDELLVRLRTAARERAMSMNHLVNAACVDFLERLLPPEEIRLTRYDEVPTEPNPIALTEKVINLSGFAVAMRDAGIHVGLQGYCVICGTPAPCALSQ